MKLLLLVTVCVCWRVVPGVGGALPPPPPPLTARVLPTPPPVAEFQRQLQGTNAPPGSGLKELPPPLPESFAPAPPPVAEYHQQLAHGEQSNVLEDSRQSLPEVDRPEAGEWELPYGYSLNHLGSQYDPTLLDNIVYDLNVGERGLTAVMDVDLQACFIDHFVRPFIVPRPQRTFYTHSLVGTMFLSPADKAAFHQMVGQTIYNMCHHLRTYWLDNHLLYQFEATLTQQVGSSGAVPNNRPQPLPQGSQSHSAMTPPPVSLYRALQEQNESPFQSNNRK